MAIIPIFFFGNVTKPSEIDFFQRDLVNYILIRQNNKFREEICPSIVDFGPKMAENG